MDHHDRIGQNGQAMILLVTFIAIAMSVITATVAVSIISGRSTTSTQAGLDALQIAESGVENAMIRLIRNPNYTGETLTVGDGTATVTVTGTTQKTIRSTGSVPDHERTIEAVTSTNGGVISVISWNEE